MHGKLLQVKYRYDLPLGTWQYLAVPGGSIAAQFKFQFTSPCTGNWKVPSSAASQPSDSSAGYSKWVEELTGTITAVAVP